VKNIKYCGNCNPDVNPERVRPLVDRLAAEAEPGTLLVVNGCSRACLSKDGRSDTLDKVIILNSQEVLRREE
jgi:hypothetical protein